MWMLLAWLVDQEENELLKRNNGSGSAAGIQLTGPHQIFVLFGNGKRFPKRRKKLSGSLSCFPPVDWSLLLKSLNR
jgi:hypothetical protein